MTLILEMLGPYMLSCGKRTIFNETCRIISSFIIQSCLFFSFFLFLVTLEQVQ